MKNSQIPLWPLVVADALMFAAVAAIAYPNIVLMEIMPASSVALCALLVLAGMAAMLAPYLLEHLRETQRISQDAKKTKENIDLIFENLSALQLMIAETREMGDAIEEKLAFQTAKDAELKFEAFKAELEKLRVGLRAKINDASAAIDEAQNAAASATAGAEQNALRLDELSENLGVLKDSVLSLGQSVASLENKNIGDAPARLDELSETINVLKLSVLALEQAAKTSENKDGAPAPETPGDGETDDDFDVAIDDPDPAQDSEPEQDPVSFEPDNTNPGEGDGLDFPDADEPESEYEEEFEQLEQPAEDAESIETPGGDEQPDAQPAQTKPSKLDGIMNKALGNAMSSAAAVEKIINAAKEPSPADQPAIAQIPENTVEYDAPAENETEDSLDFPDGGDATPTAESDPLTDTPDEQIDKSNILDDLDFDDSEKKTPLTEPPAAEQPAAQPAQQAEQQPDEQPAEPEQPAQTADTLFPEMPAEKRRAALKKDASITLRALIGIGNKPYLRGDNSLLRADKGTPMDYVEIGVWRAVLPPFEGDLNFTIWKNDERQIGDASYTIQSGKKQEITL